MLGKRTPDRLPLVFFVGLIATPPAKFALGNGERFGVCVPANVFESVKASFLNLDSFVIRIFTPKDSIAFIRLMMSRQPPFQEMPGCKRNH